MNDFDYDVLVIGSGFGGSVSALRLTEKGYRVGVLESGRRFADGDFAKTSWRLRKYVWAPALGCFGILRMTMLRAMQWPIPISVVPALNAIPASIAASA